MYQTTITIGGKEVNMRYCAATETGYEAMSGNSISVFTPKIGKDEDGNDTIIEKAQATMSDCLTLAVAAIVAAYAREGKEAPLTSTYILYESTPEEVRLLINTVIALRSEWYNVPNVVGKEMEEKQEERDPKND